MSPSASHLTKMPTLDRLLKYTKAPGAESQRFFQASSKYVRCIDAMEVRQIMLIELYVSSRVPSCQRQNRTDAANT